MNTGMMYSAYSTNNDDIASFLDSSNLTLEHLATFCL